MSWFSAFKNLFSFSSIVLNDAPEPWQIGFQDGAAPGLDGIVDLHDSIFFYLVVISVGVFWILFSVMINFSETKSPIVYKYSNHGTLIELIWTISPALILVAIAFPSFKLLYMLDSYPGELYYSYMVSMIIKRSKPLSINDIESESKSIVVYGKNGATNGIRFNRYSRYNTQLSYHQLSQIIGHLLGDGTLESSPTAHYPRFAFTQTFKRFSYGWHVFVNLSHLCQKLPTLNQSLWKGSINYNIVIHTRYYPLFSFLYELFYSENLNSETQIKGRIKIISDELLFYLNPCVLAYWAMDDGSKSGESGFYFHTKGFNFIEVYRISGMIHYIFGLKVTVQSHKNRPVIYIPSKSFKKFKNIVEPYFHKSMMYKLELKNHK